MANNQRRRPGSGFWTVAFTFLIVTAVATLPSPLYGLYRTRDDLSALTITIVYAIFAASAIGALVAVDSLATRIGRRGVVLAATATMVVSVVLLAAWKDLAGLVLGRFLTGAAVGLAAGTAIPYLIELSLRADPHASVVRARTIGRAAAGPRPSGRRHRARLPIPAAAATLTGFAANGLFAGLSGLILGTTLHRPSHALAGATLFLVFAAGVASQLVTARLPASRVLALGTVSMLVGLVLLVTAVRLSPPSLALFLISGALIGAGSGAVFKGTTGIVLDASSPQDRVAMTSALLIALYVGLSVPVIGAAIALDQGAAYPTRFWSSPFSSASVSPPRAWPC